jgi:hypothetical protein
MSDISPSPKESNMTGSHYQPSLSVVLLIIVLFVGATFLMVRSVAPSSQSLSTIPTTTIRAKPVTPKAKRVIKSRVRVQVANGTSITGLAAIYTQTLLTQSWDTLTPGNGPPTKKSVIYYNPGYRAAALEVASAIHVKSSAVLPRGTINPIAGSPSDGVIVVLGQNASSAT